MSCARWGAGKPNIRCLHRLGRRGLSSACIEGILATGAPYAAVMDGDLQHDENLLPAMLAKIKAERLDIVIASRHVGQGSVGDWQRSRVMISDVASRLGRLVVKARLTDPMSGFFMIRRDSFAETMRSLSGQGFKILLDLFASAPRPLAFAEVPFTFRQRLHGESKLDAMVAWEYLMLLLEKLVGPAVPVRFLLFALIGALGVGTHLFTLWFATHVLFVGFAIAQSVATIIAMTGNFLLNNLFTYRDRRLRGRRMWAGLISFYAVCGAGAAANVGRRLLPERRPLLVVARRARRRGGVGGVELRDVVDLHLVAAPGAGAGRDGRDLGAGPGGTAALNPSGRSRPNRRPQGRRRSRQAAGPLI